MAAAAPLPPCHASPSPSPSPDESFALVLSSLLSLYGCAMPAPTGVTRLGDGVLQARSAQEAERFCRTTGDPIRLLDLPGAPPEAVRFRCD